MNTGMFTTKSDLKLDFKDFAIQFLLWLEVIQFQKSHTRLKQNRIQLLLYPAFMAESEGLGSLRSPSSLLRKLSYYRLLLTRLRLAKDCKGSNPLLSYQKNIGYSKRYTLYFWRRVRDSNPRSVLTDTSFRVMHLRPLGQLSIYIALKAQ